jgi:hypothetical protein
MGLSAQLVFGDVDAGARMRLTLARFYLCAAPVCRVPDVVDRR